MANFKDIFNKFRKRGETQPRGNMANEAENQAEEIIKEAEKAANEAPAEETSEQAEATTEQTEAAAEETAEQPTESADASASSATESLKAELAAANDRNLRLMAEFDNFRRRSAREQLEIIETANGKLLEKLSEVLDNFERAFASENKAKDLETFEKGMQMIHDQFAKVLTDAGLEQLDPTGQEFDPNCHEALMQQPSEEIPENHVVTVFMKGYKLKNKILKPAKVIVSSGK